MFGQYVNCHEQFQKVQYGILGHDNVDESQNGGTTRDGDYNKQPAENHYRVKVK